MSSEKKKIGLIFVIGTLAFSLFQHGCSNVNNTNQPYVDSQSTAVGSANAAYSSNSDTEQKSSSPINDLPRDVMKRNREFMELCKHTPKSVNKVKATPLTGPAPLKVTFDGSSAYDPDGTKIIKWEWHFGNGQSGEGRKTTYIYEKPGNYGVGLDVTDSKGQRTSDCSDLGTGVVINVTESERKSDNSAQKDD